MKSIWFGISLLFIISCKPQPTAAIPADAPELKGYLSQEVISSLARDADFIDFIFYHMDISVSQNDPASIQQTTGFLTTQGKPADMNCPAIGRLTILSKGKIIREADIHVQGTTCAYFTVIENKKPVGTCLISPAGLKFFDSLISSYQPK